MVENSIISFKFLGTVPIEDALIGFFFPLLIILYYEHFLDEHIQAHTKNPKMKFFVISTIVATTIFGICFVFFPKSFNIPYYYMILGLLILTTPSIIEYLKYPKIFARLMKAVGYFFYFSLIYEIIGLQLDWWVFNGDKFIGWVNLGIYSFPIEELVFWIFMFSLAILSYYELFDDNEK